MKKLIILIMALFMLAQIGSTTDYFVGAYYHDVNKLFSGYKQETGYDLDLSVLLGDKWLKPHIGVTINNQGYTSKVYQGLTIGTNRENTFVGIHFGLAVHWNTVRSLGNDMLFRVALEVGYKDMSIILDHISNANLFEDNAGLDVIGVRYRF
jgi:hypothetical protein